MTKKETIRFLFQPTLPHRERRPDLALSIWDGDISTHAPAQGATDPGDVVIDPVADFNPRSRTVSDQLIHGLLPTGGISTHAPAQGATSPMSAGNSGSIFQPTLPHRERRQVKICICKYQLFQPTLPHRERPSSVTNRSFFSDISTHAPAQGATNGNFSIQWVSFYFNPRSRTGSDRISSRLKRRMSISTHAPAQGATVLVCVAGGGFQDFNPRSRTGSDGYIGEGKS